MKIKRKKSAVSEIVGVTILLGMSIAMYSVVQFMVFSYPFEPGTPSVTLVGSINESNNITIGHYGGESISIDAKILIKINEVDEPPFKASDNNVKLTFTKNPSGNSDLWEIGEFLTYQPNSVPDNASVHVTIIDIKTNSVVMMGYIRGGSS